MTSHSVCLAGCALILALSLAVFKRTQDLFSSGMARHAETEMTVMKLLQIPRSGRQRVPCFPTWPGLVEAEWRRQQLGQKAFLWISQERRSKAGYESWPDLGLNSFSNFSRLSATGKVPNWGHGPGVIRAEEYCLLEYKSQMEEVIQHVGSGLVGCIWRECSSARVCHL